MILDCVLTACNTNETYINFIPMFVNAWNSLYPNVDVKIVLVSKSIPPKFAKFAKYIILFDPIDQLSTAFISQYIRILYPALLPYQHGILITDIDMIPMNKLYFSKPIEEIENNKFIAYRDVLLFKKQIAICYNIAKNVTWQNIFEIYSVEDIIERLKSVFSKITYKGHGNTGWETDQIHLYQYVMDWNKKTTNLVVLSDINTHFNRLRRNLGVNVDDELEIKIRSGKFTDYHCLRPYNKHQITNDKILGILNK